MRGSFRVTRDQELAVAQVEVLLTQIVAPPIQRVAKKKKRSSVVSTLNVLLQTKYTDELSLVCTVSTYAFIFQPTLELRLEPIGTDRCLYWEVAVQAASLESVRSDVQEHADRVSPNRSSIKDRGGQRSTCSTNSTELAVETDPLMHKCIRPEDS